MSNPPDPVSDALPSSQAHDQDRISDACQHGSVATKPQLARPVGVDFPAHLGRYRITAVLGSGGFGVVYKGYDDDLRRDVAIKVPHRSRVARSEDVEAYLAEARVLAGLDHPHIVPVHDVGCTDDGLCFVVSKFIAGRDLAKQIKEARPSITQAAELVATVAEALHYAHRARLVHRDIKPGNILIDTSGKAYVADFGLALKEEDFGKGAAFAGTPAYMSPEQARGEGHRVDGRSDIFSLGVVFYELFTGQRPFQGETEDELLDQITSLEPRPPRQIDDAIPKELERICLKALSKRASERYTTARDLAEDLRHFFEQPTQKERDAIGASIAAPALATPIVIPKQIPVPPVKVIPKGLRSFDAGDAEFFLELLPGPRDRDGLPESLRFWKTRIETTDPDNTFAVGLIYGPSGCGKSSLVKAGLLPRLAKSMMAVYVEATAEETEARLLKGLRRQVAGLPGNLGLVEALVALRRGRFLDSGQKVLLVLDQVEHWLHAKRREDNTELVQALRQCDGSQVQCLVLLRDDFWMAATRFMRDLEIRLLEGQNSAAVDLFDLLHARKVLAAFGRAYGRLPDVLGQSTKEQHAFLDKAVAGLAQEGKVISVRLALFAEMVKGKPWTCATLNEVGGTEGIGVTFLEETFTASTAPPQHRLHQKAAQAVLKALLPEAGTDIKGHTLSQQELLEASGYAHRPRDFDELICILDSEIRLITPTDPEGKERGEDSNTQVQAGEKYYQLTHDYLVPSLRDWLTRKQKETRRGRAALLLADRTTMWHARPENRQLPSLLQWLSIRWLTQKKRWTGPQKRMMRKVGRYHALRGAAVSLLLAVVTITSWSLTHGHRLAELEAQDTLNRFHEETRTVQFLLNAHSAEPDQLEEGLTRGRQALATYELVDNPSWQQQPSVRNLSTANQAKLRTEMEDLLLLLSRATLLQASALRDPAQKNVQLQAALHLNELAETMSLAEGASQALLAQRAELVQLLGQATEARRLQERAEATPLRTARDHYLVGSEHIFQGRYREALPLLRVATEEDPQNFWAWLLLGICYDGLEQVWEARACYTTSIALWPESPLTYFNRGAVFLRQNDFSNARADFDRFIRLRPDYAEVYMNRALAWQGMKDYPAAIRDLTHAQELGAPYTRIYFMRSRVRQQAGDAAGARQDLMEGLRREPSDEKSWIARGIAKLSSDMPGALADFQKAEKLNPRSLAALQDQAHVLSELGRNQEALRVLDREIELYPDYVPAWAGRGVLRARMQQRRAAHADADEALARDYGPATQYQVAGIFALTSRQDPDDRYQALHYLSAALRKGFGFELLEQDKDLDPIRDRTEFRQLVNAARTIQEAVPKR